jgi:hypothetical protein
LRCSDVFFNAEVTVRKTILVVSAMVLIAAGIGIWKMSPRGAAKANAVSTAEPSLARMSPLEMMKEHGKALPSARDIEPF